MNFVRFILAILLFTGSCVNAGDAVLRPREPLPWNLIENGGFEQDSTGLLAVGQAVRDRENPASGDACGRFDIPPAGKIDVRISSGLRLERGKSYIIAGRMRTALTPPDSEAIVWSSILDHRGKTLINSSALRLSGNSGWRTFVYRTRGDGLTALKFSLTAQGAPGDRVWLDDLFIGPSEIELNWESAPGSGLMQAQVADGAQFEFPIPAEAQVLGVFVDGQRLLETRDCEILHGARVVRLFSTPTRGAHVAVVLRSVFARSSLHVSPLYRYAILSNTQAVRWIPDAIENFKTPAIPYATLENEITALPSIDGLPTDWSGAPGTLQLTTTAAGRYSLRLRDEKGVCVASVFEHLASHSGGTVRGEFDGRDLHGAPLTPGKYVWEVAHRPLNAFAPRESMALDRNIHFVWRSGDETLLLVQGLVEGKPAFTVATADAAYKVKERKAVLFAKKMDTFVEAAPGVYFYFDGQQIFKFQNNSASVFPRTANFTADGQTVSLAVYPTPEGPGLYVARAWKDPQKAQAEPAAAIIKLDAQGHTVATWPESASALWIENDALFAVENALRSRVNHIDGAGVKARFALEDTEEAYSLMRVFRHYRPETVNRNVRTATQLLRAPTGEFVATPHFSGGSAREIQLYSPRGVFLSAIGRGPEQTFAVQSPDYTRLWDTRATDAFNDVSNLFFSPQGELAVFDRISNSLDFWSFAPRVSNLGLTITAQAPAGVPKPPAHELLPDSLTLEILKERHGIVARVTDTVNLADNRIRDDGCSSVQRPKSLHPYRLSGPEHGSWFRAQLKVERPGKPHLLVVEYPDDAQRRTLLALRDDGADWGGEVPWLRSPGGYTSGVVAPLKRSDALYSAFITPRGALLNVCFTHVLPGEKNQAAANALLSALLGAAASRVWLLEIDEPLAANTIEEPLEGLRRSLGERRGPNGEKSPLAWFGFTARDVVLMNREGVQCYASAVTGNTLKADEDAIVRALAEIEGEIAFSFDAFSGIPKNREDLKDFGLVTEHGHSHARQLSLSYPEVQKYFTDLVIEAARRAKDNPRFKAITIHLDRTRPPLFGIPDIMDAGFETAALKAFEASSGKTVSGDAIIDKVKLLKGPLREEWSAWRCSVVHKWVLSLRDELKKVRPDLVLQLRAGSTDLRFYGFDPALYKDQESIRLIATDANVKFGDGYEYVRPTSTGDYQDLASTLLPIKDRLLEPLLNAFLARNPRSIYVGESGTSGMELELREFARAFRSLPYAPAEVLSDNDGLKVLRFGGKGAVQYFAVVNTTEKIQTAPVAIPDAPAGPTARDLVAGRDIPLRKEVKGTVFEATIPPMNLRTYRIGK